MASARLLTSVDVTRWKTLSSEKQCFFQKYDWNQLLSEVYSYQDYTIAAGDAREGFAVLPLKLVKSRLLGNRLISTPLSDHAGPTDSSLETKESLFRAAAALFHRMQIDYLEIRLSEAQSLIERSKLEQSGFKQLRSYRSFSVELKLGQKEVWQRVSTSTRRAITKAERAGVEVREGSTHMDLASYRQLHLASSSEHGVPSHPLRFFTELYRKLAPTGQAKLLLARARGLDMAGLLLLRHGSKVHYWQSALPHENRVLNPFHLLLWRAIEDSIADGFESFDLGRTRLGTGVYDFKKTWGGREYELAHFCLYRSKPPNLADPEDLRYRAASFVWKQMPKVVQSRVNPRLIREIAL